PQAYPLSLHDALPILTTVVSVQRFDQCAGHVRAIALGDVLDALVGDMAQQHQRFLRAAFVVESQDFERPAEHAAFAVDELGYVADRKSTRLNSSHVKI